MEYVTDLIAKRAELTPDNAAIEDLVTRQRASYAELDSRSGQAANLLEECGLTRGDRVALLCRNRIEFFELLFACAKLGTVLVPLNWRMPARELEPLIADCAPRLLLFGSEDASTARAIGELGVPIICLDAEGDGYRHRRAASKPLDARTRWPAEEPWYLLYTSGTTGKPKAVIQTYQMAIVNYLNIRQAIDLRNDDVTVNFLPLFHTAGINLHTLPTLLAGGSVLLLHSFDADRIIDLLATGRLDTFFGVPAVYQQLSLHPQFDEVDLSGPRSWACGGAPLPDVLITRFAERGAHVCNGFGMTETGPTVLLMDAHHAVKKIGSVGKPQLLAMTRIVRPDGEDAEPNEPGELWIAGPGVTPGYWGRSEATAQAFAPGGWLRSGDIATRDEDGYYFIIGRLKEMFISGGENVYPAEIENVLAEHPAVLEAAVTGVADETWGEVGRAYVLLRENQSTDAPSLRRFCRERLAGYKVPKSFVFVRDFPRTAAGKVQKHLLSPPEPIGVK